MLHQKRVVAPGLLGGKCKRKRNLQRCRIRRRAQRITIPMLGIEARTPDAAVERR
jgi:hypothetical protein